MSAFTNAVMLREALPNSVYLKFIQKLCYNFLINFRLNAEVMSNLKKGEKEKALKKIYKD